MYKKHPVACSMRRLRSSSMLVVLLFLVLGIASASMAIDDVTQANPDSKGEQFQVQIQAVRAPGIIDLVGNSETTLCLGEWVQLRAITLHSMSKADQVQYQWDLDGDGDIDISGTPVDGSTLTRSPGSRRVSLYAIDRNNPTRIASDVATYNVLSERVTDLQAEAIRGRTRSFFYVGLGILIVGALAAGLLAVNVSIP